MFQVVEQRLRVTVSLKGQTLGVVVVEVHLVLQCSSVFGPHQFDAFRCDTLERVKLARMDLESSDRLKFAHSFVSKCFRCRRAPHAGTSAANPGAVRARRGTGPGGRVSNARTPSPTTPAPIMKCSSSIKPVVSRSFQRR